MPTHYECYQMFQPWYRYWMPEKGGVLLRGAGRIIMRCNVARILGRVAPSVRFLQKTPAVAVQNNFSLLGPALLNSCQNDARKSVFSAWKIVLLNCISVISCLLLLGHLLLIFSRCFPGSKSGNDAHATQKLNIWVLF